MLIVRHSFIQMSKLTNLTGRINYISSHARQENLYAVHETAERKFWNILAKCNRTEFAKSGTVGKCIEARELIIALPESMTEYEPDILLKLFTEHFKQRYDVECISALHHNKAKTNYHIHLIFSERRLLDNPIEKIATRNMFYNENGKHVRTKKEILDEAKVLRKGCKIILKGEVYERMLFTIKDRHFKNEGFLEEVKQSYTDLINLFVKDKQEELQVFNRGGAYLPMKKIGKNNPKAERITEDNEMRKRWNRTVDRALLSGVPEMQVIQIKRTEISVKAKEAFQHFGSRPQFFVTIILLAIKVLEILIRQILKLAHQKSNRMKSENEKISVKPMVNQTSAMSKEIPERPRKTPLAEKYQRLSDIYNKLKGQNTAIYQSEQKLSALEQEITQTKGVFKGKQRKELQGQIEELQGRIENMKQYLSSIVQEYGYQTVKEFLSEYFLARTENFEYRKAVDSWDEKYGIGTKSDSIKGMFEYHKKARNSENASYRTNNSSDRGAR